jgi:hypothetical protein
MFDIIHELALVDADDNDGGSVGVEFAKQGLFRVGVHERDCLFA